MADITTDNINTIAELAANISDGDYIFIYKDGAQAFSKIEKSVFMQGASGGTDISDVLSNDWNDSSRQHVPSARQMNLMYNNLIMVYNGLADLLSKLANSAFSTARPTIGELDWVGSSSSYSIGYSLTHCHKTDASPTSVAEGDPFTAIILPDAGYTLNGVTASGSGFGQTYDSANDKIVISASNVQNGLTITCAAVTFQVSVNYTLTGFASESNTTMQSGGSFTKVLSPNNGYVVKTISITMGGTDVTSSVWTASTRTISIPVVTGNIVVTATAEESSNHLVTYNLHGVTQSSDSPDEIADDNIQDVTIVLQKGSDWADYANENVDLSARDILLMVGGKYLEREMDFSTEKSGNNITITIPANKITGDVVVMNIPWKESYVCSHAMNAAPTTGSPAQLPGEVRITTNLRSVYTNLFMPIPTSCNTIEIFASNNNPTMASYAVGCAFYDEAEPNDVGGSCVRGVGFSSTARTIDLTSQAIPSDATDWDYAKSDAARADYVSFRTSCYVNQSGLSNANSVLNASYIYDITNDKFIWYGTSVDKTSIRNNHQS